MDRNQGITNEPLFVGVTRPAMKWGVTYAGLLFNMMIVMQAFILTKNLLWLLAFAPIHLLMQLVCLYEPRFFDLLLVWLRTRGWPALIGVTRHWKANTYSPLSIDLPDRHGRRKAPTAVHL
ncbi:type IV secretion system protein VirB3 [Denitromonas iodatirespirans]|uniref:VirB3 family type IV secretion system protein n=1 Tax=Denitromonas iodatirespirans TaxID=2795389 RepID=A0A944DAZ2_DENI1|nr:VirB3 family type IV secretion system protein [Denitromonas iodatirespirans]MBT0963005.1 VirB3 family type IV secretion system protein [Denitromonas iodatirespirans]MCZ4307052.1 VirB3 family type IV secretion system protein [Zoogloeaceae bacterium G21618-S1]TVT73191.1 MAG: type IV secretion system protein VirB3 [Denitromonas halophila]